MTHEGHEGNRRCLAVIFAAALVVVTVSAQEPPTFEVASVKKVDQTPTGSIGGGAARNRGGMFWRPATTVAQLLEFAYDLRDFQVIGGPAWVRSDRFEVQARAGSTDVPRDQLRAMVQSLLADRFALVTRKERREMRFYAMVTARGDRRAGPYLYSIASTADCNVDTRKKLEKDRPKPTTGYVMAGGCGPLAGLATVGSRFMEVPIFDRTGLTGQWMFDVYFAPGPTGSPLLSGPPDPNLASFETALQEQLGLKLEPTRGPVDVLVIESVQQPTEN